MMRWPLVLPCLLLLAAQPAWALQPSKHRQLAEAACIGAGLPQAFCQRMGKEAFETDYKEWKDLSAHAQRQLGEDRCTAADAALARVDRLAREVVATTRAGQLELGAIALGRLVHTLQDECAHHGMTNEEHAFYSLVQTCTHQDVSPDVQPEALACADARTHEVFALVAPALGATRWDGVTYICRDTDNNDSCATATLPGPWSACEFLAQHRDWDGDDSRWNDDLVGPALVAAVRAGLAGDAATRSACSGNLSAIDPVMPRATVTDRRAGCELTDILCLGKVDEDSADDDAKSTGCTANRGGSLLLALALLLVRRRR